MTDHRYRRARSEETKAFAGVQHRKARPEQTERATRHMARSHQDRKLAAKLDALLGRADWDEDED
jgi:hypothetical protein